MVDTNWKKENINLTEMEEKVVKHLLESETLEDAKCDSPAEIAECTDINVKSLRGVIASLVKKDVAYVDELISGCGDWVILYDSVDVV